jgi:hypothetical protein
MPIQRSIYQKFPMTFTNSDFGITSTSSITVLPNQWIEVGSYVVKAGQMLAVGQNRPNGNVIAGSPVYIRFDNSTTGQLRGIVELVYYNPQKNRSLTILRETTERLSFGADGDVNKAVLLPEYSVALPEDGILAISFFYLGSTSTTIDGSDADTKILLPVTVYQ